MAKQIKSKIKLQVDGGAATPAPPVGSALGQHGLNIMDFCKKFNAMTADRKGEKVSVVITVYTDKTFDFITKTPLVSQLILKRADLAKGAGKAGAESVGQITEKDVEEIAKIKMPDLNAIDIEGAKKVIKGSARSMGIKVVD